MLFHGVGGGSRDNQQLAGRPLGRGFVLWAVLCGHAPLPERFCVWAAFCGAALLTTLWSALPPPFAYAFFFKSFQVSFTLNILIYAFSWGGGRFKG